VHCSGNGIFKVHVLLDNICSTLIDSMWYLPKVILLGRYLVKMISFLAKLYCSPASFVVCKPNYPG
jgi:hypothetical protein